MPVQPGWRSWQVLKTSFRQNMILTAPGRHLGSPDGEQQQVLYPLLIAVCGSVTHWTLRACQLSYMEMDEELCNLYIPLHFAQLASPEDLAPAEHDPRGPRPAPGSIRAVVQACSSYVLSRNTYNIWRLGA